MSDLVDVRSYYDRQAVREQFRLTDPYRCSEPLVLRAALARLLAGEEKLGTVCEVGSGPGHYVPWLCTIAERVLCIDFSAVELAAVPIGDTVAAVQADARFLPLGDEVVSMVLILGPHYHLPDPADRAQMLAEAVRVLAPGGWLVLAGLNRTGVALKTALHKPSRAWMARGVLGHALCGPTAVDAGALGDFPPAHLSDARHLQIELSAAGLDGVRVCGSESFTVFAPGLTRRARRVPGARWALDALLVSTASGRMSLALSEHLFAVARKPGTPN